MATIFPPIRYAPPVPQTECTKLQERDRKHIERLLGVLHGRCRILHSDSDLGSDKDVVLVLEFYEILHNILIRMEQSGKWYDTGARSLIQYSLPVYV